MPVYEKYKQPRIAIAIILEDGTRHTLESLTADPTSRSYWKVHKVEWDDGSWSWAKAWKFWVGPRHGDGHYVYTRIGAGAGGEQTVWTNTTTVNPRIGRPDW